MTLAGFVLITARHSTLLAEGVGGAFLLLCGVIYPIDFLPNAWQSVAKAIPLTYWMEGTRRAFSLPHFGQAMQSWSDVKVTAALIGLSVVYLVVAVLVFKLCSYYAKKHGKIDQITHY